MSNNYTIGYPVNGFPIKFKWQTDWFDPFEKQVELIQSDIKRALADDRIVVYLSCPISGRGGGHPITNVEIARYVEQSILKVFGTKFWVLNPAQYQMQSKEGRALFRANTNTLAQKEDSEYNFEKLIQQRPPDGGDYMRMWTRVLVEDDDMNLGDRFSVYYFLGPSDVRDFFTLGGAIDLTTGVEEYFARKYCSDPMFHNYFSLDSDGNPLPIEEWENRRKNFLRYYSVRASANFSSGSHDEWNILRILNQLRLKKLGIGSQIAGYFDGRQIDPGSSETAAFPGYAIES